MKKIVLVGALSLFVAMNLSPLMAAESGEHQNHQPAQTEHEHGKSQSVPEKAAAGSHGDQMENKMAKMSVRMDKMKQELAQAEERMTALKGILENAQKRPPGEERNKLLAEHGAGLRTILAGFRTQMEKMMAQMEQHMQDKDQKGGKQGMDHGGDKKDHGGGGMMNQEMMDDMAGHHEIMKKRMALQGDLLGQMEGHLAALSAPR